MKKIMFSDKFGLTKAVLEGRKTMTRRLPGKEWKDIMPGLIGQDLSKANTPFKVGEVVAVAQSYKEIHEKENISPNEIFNRDYYEQTEGWTNKMFVRASLMYHHIRITNVRVERLQDISDEDCVKEGVWEAQQVNYTSIDGIPFSPCEAFAALIDKVSGKGTWKSNPWVFVYEFELVK